jgi:hypothetical protein
LFFYPLIVLKKGGREGTDTFLISETPVGVKMTFGCNRPATGGAVVPRGSML